MPKESTGSHVALITSEEKCLTKPISMIYLDFRYGKALWENTEDSLWTAKPSQFLSQDADPGYVFNNQGINILLGAGREGKDKALQVCSPQLSCVGRPRKGRKGSEMWKANTVEEATSVIELVC